MKTLFLVILVAISQTTFAADTDYCEVLLTQFNRTPWQLSAVERAHGRELLQANDPFYRDFQNHIISNTSTVYLLRRPPVEVQTLESEEGKRADIVTAAVPEIVYENSLAPSLAILKRMDKEATAIQKLMATKSSVAWGVARARWYLFINNPTYRSFMDSGLDQPSLETLVTNLDGYDHLSVNYFAKGSWNANFTSQVPALLKGWNELGRSLPNMVTFSFSLMKLKMDIEFINRYRLANLNKLRSQLDAELLKP